MKRLAVLSILFTFVMSASAFAVGGDVKWNSLKEGMAKAKAEKKPLIVDFFYGKGCPRCELLEKNVYSNPQIAKKINDEFIPVFVDLTKPLSEEEEDLGQKYDYKKDCLMLFLDSDMTVLKDPSGKRMCFADNIEAEVFNSYLDMIKAQMKK
jgi:thioredoxin-related protein